MSDIVVENLCKSFGERRVLSGLSLCFPAGTRTMLMGDSGCGKTTLLRILMGLERAEGGAITGMEGRRISVVFQEDRLCPEFSALSNVRLACRNSIPDDCIREHLTKVGLGDSTDRPVRELSGGMKRRVAIVRAVLAQKDVLLLDEPLKGLDEHTRASTAQYIKRNTDGVTTIMVSHDPEEVALMDARLISLE